MPNEFLAAEQIVAGFLGILEREVVLPQFCTRLAESDFVGAKGDTVTMRVPSYLEAREYNWRDSPRSAIVIDEIAEVGVDVKLDHMPYSAVALTDENLTLDIREFGEQVLSVQARAIVRYMEQLVADTIENAPHAWTVEEADPYLAAAKARSALNKAAVPMAGRVLLLGADVETKFLASPLLVRADTSGSDSALRDAEIGRIAGMPTFVSMFIDPDNAYALHTSAFGLANMAPVVPDGVSFGQSQTYDGYAVRFIRDYDAGTLQDRSVLSSFIGCSSVDDGAQLTGPERGDHDEENIRVVKLEGIGE